MEEPDLARKIVLVSGPRQCGKTTLARMSAQLDSDRKRGESLAGRFLPYRLHPFDVKEARAEVDPEDAFARIMTVGGFPEPFLEYDPAQYQR